MGLRQSPLACWNTCHALTADFGVREYLTLTTNNFYGILMYACFSMLIFEPNGNCYVPHAVT